MAGVAQALFDAMNAIVGRAASSDEGEFVIIADIDRWNIGTQAIDPLYVATSEWSTIGTDTPANQPYVARLIAPSFEQNIVGGADYGHNTAPITGQIKILNEDAFLDDEVDPASYSLRGREIRFRGGLSNWDLTQFVDMPGGYNRIVDVQTTEEFIELTLTALHERPDRPVQDNRFGGFGSAYDFAGTADWNIKNLHDVGERDWSFQIRFNYPANGGAGILAMKRSTSAAASGSIGWQIETDASEQLKIRLDDGTSLLTSNIGSASEYDDDLWHMLTVIVKRSTDEMFTWVDNVQEGGTLDISGITGNTLTNSDDMLIGSDPVPALQFPGLLDEPRMWYRALTNEELLDNWDSSLNGLELGLISLHRMDGTPQMSHRWPGRIRYDQDGASNISMGTSAGDPGTGSFTALCWFTAKTAANQVIIGRKTDDTAGSVGWSLRTSAAGGIRAIGSDGTTDKSAIILESADITDGRLWGVAIRVDRTNDEMKVYALPYPRGDFEATATTDISAWGASTLGGGAINFRCGRYDGGGQNHTGGVCHVMYIPLVLTDIQINRALSSQLADQDDLSDTVPPEADKTWAGTANAHYWPVNENTGTTVNDRWGAVNGTASSSLLWVITTATVTSGASGSYIKTNDGRLEVKGKPRPIPFGEPQRISPTLIDDNRRIYTFSDVGFADSESVVAVYAGNKLLVLTTDYTVQLTEGTITLVAVEDGAITMIVRGITESGRTLKYPGEIIQWMWENLLGIDVGDIDTASVDAYDVKNPWEIGEYLDDRDISLESFQERLLLPRGFVFRTLGNKLALGCRDDPDNLGVSVLTLDDTTVQAVNPVPVPPPATLIRAGYDRTHFISNASAFNAGEGEKARSEDEWLYATVISRTVATNEADAVSRTYETQFRKQADAAIAVGLMKDIDTVTWRGWEVTQTGDFMGASLGDPVTLTYPRYGISGVHQVLGHRYGMGENGLPFSVVTLVGR